MHKSKTNWVSSIDDKGKTTGAGVLGLGREHASKTVKMHYCFEKLLQSKTNWVYSNNDQESSTKIVHIMAPGIGFF